MKNFCTNCGNQLNEEDKFCSSCGNSINHFKDILEVKKDSNQKGDDYSSDKLFCVKCNYEIKPAIVKCPNCKEYPYDEIKDEKYNEELELLMEETNQSKTDDLVSLSPNNYLVQLVNKHLIKFFSFIISMFYFFELIARILKRKDVLTDSIQSNLELLSSIFAILAVTTMLIGIIMFIRRTEILKLTYLMAACFFIMASFGYYFDEISIQNDVLFQTTKSVNKKTNIACILGKDFQSVSINPPSREAIIFNYDGSVTYSFKGETIAQGYKVYSRWGKWKESINNNIIVNWKTDYGPPENQTIKMKSCNGLFIRGNYFGIID